MHHRSAALVCADRQTDSNEDLFRQTDRYPSDGFWRQTDRYAEPTWQLCRCASNGWTGNADVHSWACSPAELTSGALPLLAQAQRQPQTRTCQLVLPILGGGLLFIPSAQWKGSTGLLTTSRTVKYLGELSHGDDCCHCPHAIVLLACEHPAAAKQLPSRLVSCIPCSRDCSWGSKASGLMFGAVMSSVEP